MDNSPLNKLPSELRNTIAEMVLFHKGGVAVDGSGSGSIEPRNALALAQTCKQMREDYTHLFYDINTFTLYNAWETFRCLSTAVSKFENAIGPTSTQLVGSMDVVEEMAYHSDWRGININIHGFFILDQPYTQPTKIHIPKFSIEMLSPDGEGSYFVHIHRKASGKRRVEAEDLRHEIDALVAESNRLGGEAPQPQIFRQRTLRQILFKLHE